MKKSAGLYLSAREASAELAISQATLYAYVEPRADPLRAVGQLRAAIVTGRRMSAP